MRGKVVVYSVKKILTKESLLKYEWRRVQTDEVFIRASGPS